MPSGSDYLRELVLGRFPAAAPSGSGVPDVSIELRGGPEDAALVGLNAESLPALATGGIFTASDAGDVYLEKFLVRKTFQAVNLHHVIHIAGTGLANCFMGIYSAGGSLLASTADLSTSWQSTGSKSAALNAPVFLIAGTTYYFALLAGTIGGAPEFAGGLNAVGGTSLPRGATAAGSRLFQVLVGSATALPASITMSATAELADRSMPWVGC